MANPGSTKKMSVSDTGAAKRGKLPPKGTAARLALASGLWSHLSAEEIARMKQDIFGSRKSAA